jgi:hypothetical protein
VVGIDVPNGVDAGAVVGGPNGGGFVGAAPNAIELGTEAPNVVFGSGGVAPNVGIEAGSGPDVDVAAGAPNAKLVVGWELKAGEVKVPMVGAVDPKGAVTEEGADTTNENGVVTRIGILLVPNGAALELATGVNVPSPKGVVVPTPGMPLLDEVVPSKPGTAVLKGADKPGEATGVFADAAD